MQQATYTQIIIYRKIYLGEITFIIKLYLMHNIIDFFIYN